MVTAGSVKEKALWRLYLGKEQDLAHLGLDSLKKIYSLENNRKYKLLCT